MNEAFYDMSSAALDRLEKRILSIPVEGITEDDVIYLVRALRHYRSCYCHLLKEKDQLEDNCRNFSLWPYVRPHYPN